jgi:RND family efflux transporter MFP subunit
MMSPRSDGGLVVLGALLAAMVAVAVGALAPGCRSDPAAVTKGGGAGTGARPVRVVAAERGALPRVVTVTGTLAAEEQVALGMKTSGRLGEIAVDLGSRTVRGQALARLISTDFDLRVEQAAAALQQAQARLGLAPEAADDRIDPDQTPLVRQARAMLEEARVGRERAQRLSDEQLVSAAEMDAAEASFQVAEGRYQDALEEILNRQAVLAQRRTELELARQQMKDSVLYAPFDGAVRERMASTGQFVAAGQPIVTLVRTHPLRLRLAIPERDAAGVREGQGVRLTVEGDTDVYLGRVARLSPAIEERNRTLMVEAEVPNRDGALRPGSFASAEIVTAADQPVVFVPVSSIVTFAGIEKVIVVHDGKTVEKRVRTGRRAERQVEILEGIEAGETVVVEPGNLAGGQAVAIVS